MPQFDFYTWSALGFWTTNIFQAFYLYLLLNMINPLSEIQKTLQKVKFFFKKKKNIPLIDFFCNLYLAKKNKHNKH